MTKLINLYGAAGAGKSTTAMGITHYLKLKGYRVEYVSEYAKDLVNEGSEHKLKHQLYVFAKQLKKLSVLMDKGLDYVVTDSPLLLSYFYGNKYGNVKPYFKDMVLSHINDYETLNIFINRDIEYDDKLRIQSSTESDLDSVDLYNLLVDLGIEFVATKTSVVNTQKGLDNIFPTKKESNPIVYQFLTTFSSKGQQDKNEYILQHIKPEAYDVPSINLGRRQGHTNTLVNFINNSDLKVDFIAPTVSMVEEIARDINKKCTITSLSSYEKSIRGHSLDLIVFDSCRITNSIKNYLASCNLLHKTVSLGC